MTTSFKPSRSVIYWLWFGILLVLMMVVIGGMTRLTHSGLSMVHWTFTGSLPPLNDADWVAEFDRYKSSPEFVELHSHFTLSDFKSIFWWEYGHRMFGRMIGLAFILPFIFFLWRKKIPSQMIPQFVLIMGLGAFQAILGWFMVKSGLADVPRVSHYRLAAHLTTAFITCGYILWVAMNYSEWGQLRESNSRAKRHFLVLGSLVLLQVIFGAFVAGLRAGWVHNTWPLMDGSLIAPSVTAMEPILLNFFEGKSGVQFIHRTLGLLIAGYALWIWLASGLSKIASFSKPVKTIGLAVLIQVTLGVLTLLLRVPISIAVIHQVFALIVLLSVVWGLHQSTSSKSSA